MDNRRRSLRRTPFPVTRFPVTTISFARLPIAGFTRFPGRPLVARDLVEVLVFLKEVGDVQERVALQPQVHERRLHSRQNAGDSSFVNTTGERIFIGALEVNFTQQIVFDQGHLGLVPIGRDHQFLTHSGLLPRGIPRGD
jgi:hypothetical protein